MTEFRPIPGCPGYEVSAIGEVRSIRRGKPRTINLRSTPEGYLKFPAWADGSFKWRTVHIAVAEAFISPRPPGMQVRHLDGDPSNNLVSNLAWGTPSENMQDQVRHGSHFWASRTHCKNGHPFDEANTYLRPSDTQRFCRTCTAERSRRYRARKAAS